MPFSVNPYVFTAGSSDVNPYQFSYLRSNFGLPDWTPMDVPSYGQIYYVDWDNGSDTNDGRTEGNPTKTLYEAAQSWIADGAPTNTGFYLRASSSHKEYLSKDGEATYNGPYGTTEINQSPFMNRDGAAGATIDIRTHPDDVAAGNLCVLDGSEVPLDWTTRDNNNIRYPNILHIRGAYYRVMELELHSSAGHTIRVEHGTNRSENNTFQNLHVHHGFGDGIVDNRFANGDSPETAQHNSVIRDCLVHHMFETVNDGNSASGVKFAYGVANTYDGILSFKCSDDGLDAYGQQDYEILDSVSWLNGYYWETNSSKRDADNWSPWENGDDGTVNETRLTASGGNGMGFKLGGGSQGNAAHVRHCTSFWNKKFGFTQNKAEDSVYYNLTAYSNDKGFVARDGPSWLANCVDYDNASGVLIDDGNTPGTYPYDQKNSWPNQSQSESTNNFNLTLTDSDFVSVNPWDDGFLQPTSAGAIGGVTGWSDSSEWTSESGWENVSMPDIHPTIGAQDTP